MPLGLTASPDSIGQSVAGYVLLATEFIQMNAEGVRVTSDTLGEFGWAVREAEFRSSRALILARRRLIGRLREFANGFRRYSRAENSGETWKKWASAPDAPRQIARVVGAGALRAERIAHVGSDRPKRRTVALRFGRIDRSVERPGSIESGPVIRHCTGQKAHI